MKVLENLYLLLKKEYWSRVTLFVALYSFSHIVSNHAVEAVNYYQITDIRDSIPIDFTRALIAERRCQLITFDANNMKSYIGISVTTIQTERCTFEFYLKSKIYYTYYPGTILSSASSKSTLQIPTNNNFDKGSNNIYDLAVDTVNDKLYIITVNHEQESDKLIVVDIASGDIGIVISDLDFPKHIEVDPFASLLFIQQHSSILRANMDGTSRVKLIKKVGITKFTIDRQSQTIFWSTSKGIHSSGYHSAIVKLVTSIGSPIQDLAVLGKQLFWLSTPYGLMQPNTTISHCKMDGSHHCDNISTTNIPFEDTQAIKAYDFDELDNMMSKKTNPCNNIKPSCQHLCLLRKNGYSCACKVGYRLNYDKHTCQLANDKFLLYIQDSYAKGRIIGSEMNDSLNFVDAIYPNGLNSEAKFVSFDYDYQDNLIFFTDSTIGDNKLYMKNLLATQDQTIIHSYGSIEVISTATDWVSKNIYQLVSYNSQGRRCAVMVHRYPEINNGNTILGYSTTLFEFPTELKGGSIVVHPLRGYIFIMTRADTDKAGDIYRANLDGKNLTRYKTGTSLYGMAIDFEVDLLYWINTDRTQLISHNLDNRPITKMINIAVVKDPMSVSVDGRYVYVGNLTTIWRFDKDTGKNPIKIVESVDIYQPKTIIGTKIYGDKAQPIADGHPCAFYNGGCQKFCFAVPVDEKNLFAIVKLRKQCRCTEGEILSLDGLGCGIPFRQQNF